MCFFFFSGGNPSKLPYVWHMLHPTLIPPKMGELPRKRIYTTFQSPKKETVQTSLKRVGSSQWDMDVSENSGTPKSSILIIGFSIIFTIHFGVYTSILGNTHVDRFSFPTRPHDPREPPFFPLWDHSTNIGMKGFAREFPMWKIGNTSTHEFRVHKIPFRNISFNGVHVKNSRHDPPEV